MDIPFQNYQSESNSNIPQNPLNKVIILNDLSSITQTNEVIYNITDSIESNYSNEKMHKKNKKKEYKCPEPTCGKIFLDKTALKKHIVIHGEKLFICKICQKKFLDNSKLRRHSLVHSGEKPYQCPICSKKFSLDFNLKTHMRIHSGEKPYACIFPGCFKRFSQSSNLSAHEKIHEIIKDNKTLEELNMKPIFNENPIKYMIENIYSGTETLFNINKINEIYEKMKKGKEEQIKYYNQQNGNKDNSIGVQKRIYIKHNICLNKNKEKDDENTKRQIFLVFRKNINSDIKSLDNSNINNNSLFEDDNFVDDNNNFINNNSIEEADLNNIINEINKEENNFNLLENNII